ncbi:hypothetical protein FB597_102421 [Herbaspirillum sp. SJZ099]|nr:hypothetical protein FB597_102421 [Herbaspirillum sp. SJZ099]
MVLLDKFIFIHGLIGIEFVSHIVNDKTAESKKQNFLEVLKNRRKQWAQA